jgi:DNA (cytosine-5)-methyltransferase 1
MTGATLFSGILAPEVALPEIEWRWCAEIDPFCCALIRERHPGIPNLGDVTANDFIDRALALGPLDLLVAGSPCQAFSVAGNRNSLDDSRGNLTLRLVEVVHAVEPRYLLWENVPGVLSTHDNAFGCFLAGLVGAAEALAPVNGWTDAGVVDGPSGAASWRILDAQYFGLAQRRKRVFVVFRPGAGGVHPAEILFEWESLRRDYPPGREAGERSAPTIGARTTAGGGLGTDFDCDGGLVSMALNGKGGSGRSDAESETFVNTGHGWWGKLEIAAGLTAKDRREATFVTTMAVADSLTVGANQTSGFIGEVVAHALRAEGFDASEDGTGRGIPLIAAPLMSGSGHAAGHGSRTGIGKDATLIPAVAPCLTENYGKQPDNSDTSAGPMLIPILEAGALHAGEKSRTDSIAVKTSKSGGSGSAMAVRRLTPL